MKRSISCLLLSLAAFSLGASTQGASAQGASKENLELSGGYAHISGDLGLNGFDVGVAAWFTPRFAVAVDYDSGWNTSRIGIFELTQTGLVVAKSHLQDFLIGPRFFFPGVIKTGNKRVAHLLPFAEAQFGGSHLNSSLRTVSTNINQSAADSAFSYMLGGGADYRLYPHWVARLKLGLLRTHIADTGQSRLRLSLGVAYTLGAR
jgi:opacity protein-like surface antigen